MRAFGELDEVVLHVGVGVLHAILDEKQRLRFPEGLGPSLLPELAPRGIVDGGELFGQRFHIHRDEGNAEGGDVVFVEFE